MTTRRDLSLELTSVKFYDKDGCTPELGLCDIEVRQQVCMQRPIQAGISAQFGL